MCIRRIRGCKMVSRIVFIWYELCAHRFILAEKTGVTCSLISHNHIIHIAAVAREEPELISATTLYDFLRHSALSHPSFKVKCTGRHFETPDRNETVQDRDGLRQRRKGQTECITDFQFTVSIHIVSCSRGLTLRSISVQSLTIRTITPMCTFRQLLSTSLVLEALRLLHTRPSTPRLWPLPTVTRQSLGLPMPAEQRQKPKRTCTANGSNGGRAAVYPLGPR